MSDTTFLEQCGTGAFHEPDPRDYSLGAAEPFDWTAPELPDIPLVVGSQNGSLSCVGQTTSEIAAILHYLKTNEIKQFSARDIYCQIFLPNGGAQLRDGMDSLTKKGIETEIDLPSIPESEEHMRDKTGLDLNKAAQDFDLALHGNPKYAFIPANIDEFAAALRDHKCMMIGVYGDNAGWHTADVVPPATPVWGHAICGVKAVMRNGKKAIKFLNHWSSMWGENGYGYLSEDYFTAGQVMAGYVPTTNYINPNPPTPMPPLPENHFVQDSSEAGRSGSFGIVIDNQIRVVSRYFNNEDRAGLLALTVQARQSPYTNLPAAEWDAAEKVAF